MDIQDFIIQYFLKQKKNNNIKIRLFRIAFILLLLIICFENHKTFLNYKNYIETKSFKELFNSNIKKHSILIFEPNKYHHECSPGFSKYFIDLGYNVDLLIHRNGIDSFYLFDGTKNIRLFIFKNLKHIQRKTKKLSRIMKKYDFVLVQSTDQKRKDLYINLKFLKRNNTIFVFHEITFAERIYSKYFNGNRIWTLGNMSKGKQVNPHYFGNIKIRELNSKTRFFMTSTAHRSYYYLIETVMKLYENNFSFEIIITGRSKRFLKQKIPECLHKIFKFKSKVSFLELYRDIESSDFIIIPLNPKSKNDNLYKTTKVTGSMQLVLGFLKPALINKKFSDFYNLNNKNSLIYNNHNLYDVMKKAINMNNKEYKILQSNLYKLENKIYNASIDNIIKTIDEKNQNSLSKKQNIYYIIPYQYNLIIY